MAPIFTSLFNLITATRSFETRPSPFLRFVPRLTVSISNFSLTRILPSPLLSSHLFAGEPAGFPPRCFFSTCKILPTPLSEFLLLRSSPNVRTFFFPLLSSVSIVSRLKFIHSSRLDFKKEVDAVPRRPRKS